MCMQPHGKTEMKSGNHAERALKLKKKMVSSRTVQYIVPHQTTCTMYVHIAHHIVYNECRAIFVLAGILSVADAVGMYSNSSESHFQLNKSFDFSTFNGTLPLTALHDI